jgi:hypothetical protein
MLRSSYKSSQTKRPLVYAESRRMARDAGGCAHDQAAEERWRRNDGGLHVIAAAPYRVMREDHYDETGGDVAAYLRDPAHVQRIVAALDAIAANGL